LVRAHTYSTPDSQGNPSTLAAYAWSYDADSRVTDGYSYSDTIDTDDRTAAASTWAHAHYHYDADGQLSDTTSGGVTTAAAT
jgi:hypothetical protein